MDHREAAALAERLEHRPPQEIVTWAADRFAPRVAFGTGFGREGCVLVDIIGRAALPVRLFTLDTGLFFDETQRLWRQLERRYGVSIHAVRPELTLDQQATAYGDELWRRDPDRCCALRKVAPLRVALEGVDAWVTAIRSDQTPERSRARVVEYDARFGRVKINPLLRWSSADVDAYIAGHDVPTNPLHTRGYPSIGCWPCTSRVAEGEDPRAGRWRDRGKTECGLHAPQTSDETEIETGRLAPSTIGR